MLLKINALVFLALIILPLSGQDAAKTDRHPTNTNNSQHSSEPSVTVINQENACAPQNKSTDQNANSAQGRHDYVFWGFIVNLVLAIGTIAIAIFAVIQGIATKKMAVIAEKTLALVAADIHLEAASLVPLGKITPTSYVAIRIKNYSGTRAEHVQNHIRVIIPGAPDSQSSDIGFPLAPSGSQLIRFNEFIKFLKEDIYNEIASGKIELKIIGTVTYKDIFGNEKTLEIKEGVLNPLTGAFYFGLPQETSNQQPSSSD